MASSGPLAERVTVTMPAELVAGIDRVERNRSRFIAEAVRHELQRRQRLELQRSLQSPHPDSLATAALGLTDWAEAIPEADSDLLDPNAGTPLTWQAEVGWINPETDGIQP
ncbi:MAG: ribbon-helix-helix domain-containing protein [Cyanobacteriota bacterium]|nr:ribbon-helix-helix domain-containing protein [Cyanobacteriota bacterium]